MRFKRKLIVGSGNRLREKKSAESAGLRGEAKASPLFICAKGVYRCNGLLVKGDVREKGMRRGLSVDGALNEERCVKIGRCRRSQEEKLSFDGGRKKRSRK